MRGALAALFFGLQAEGLRRRGLGGLGHLLGFKAVAAEVHLHGHLDAARRPATGRAPR